MSSPLRLFFVLDETRFFHPEFFEDFLRQTEDTVVGCGIVSKVPEKSSLDSYLRRHWYFLRPLEIVKLQYRSLKLGLSDLLGTPHSVKSVAQKNRITNFEIEGSINTAAHLATIRSANPDILVSSNSLYFGKELLRIPRLASLNRHSSLLPKFGGLWPVFQAVRSGEAWTGASIHTMTEKIDEGVVLAQRKVEVGDQTIYELYQECFKASADALLEAIAKVKRGDLSSVAPLTGKSYFSFPTSEQWAEFRHRGRRFI
jgi:methionyl-tRNA formyltransferase